MSFSGRDCITITAYNSIIRIVTHNPEMEITSKIKQLDASLNLQNSNNFLIGILKSKSPQVLDFIQETQFCVSEVI